MRGSLLESGAAPESALAGRVFSFSSVLERQARLAALEAFPEPGAGAAVHRMPGAPYGDRVAGGAAKSLAAAAYERDPGTPAELVRALEALDGSFVEVTDFRRDPLRRCRGPRERGARAGMRPGSGRGPLGPRVAPLARTSSVAVPCRRRRSWTVPQAQRVHDTIPSDVVWRESTSRSIDSSRPQCGHVLVAMAPPIVRPSAWVDGAGVRNP